MGYILGNRDHLFPIRQSLNRPYKGGLGSSRISQNENAADIITNKST